MEGEEGRHEREEEEEEEEEEAELQWLGSEAKVDPWQ